MATSVLTLLPFLQTQTRTGNVPSSPTAVQFWPLLLLSSPSLPIHWRSCALLPIHGRTYAFLTFLSIPTFSLILVPSVSLKWSRQYSASLLINLLATNDLSLPSHLSHLLSYLILDLVTSIKSAMSPNPHFESSLATYLLNLLPTPTSFHPSREWFHSVISSLFIHPSRPSPPSLLSLGSMVHHGKHTFIYPCLCNNNKICLQVLW